MKHLKVLSAIVLSFMMLLVLVLAIRFFGVPFMSMFLGTNINQAALNCLIYQFYYYFSYQVLLCYFFIVVGNLRSMKLIKIAIENDEEFEVRVNENVVAYNIKTPLLLHKKLHNESI
ncbi:MAG: hypothetical protein M1308_11225 [Actinobacteria bacterium]|nr:hypothetical protein [Actinomycetota bacterium]